MKRRVLSRKQVALKWLTRLIVLAVVCGGLGWYHFTPSYILSRHLQSNTIADGSLIHSEWGQYAPMKDKLICLSRGQEGILVSAVDFHLQTGWRFFGTGFLLEPGDPEKKDGAWIVTKKNHAAWICLAGFVPYGEDTPTFSIGHRKQSAVWVDDIGYQCFAQEPVTVTPTANIPTSGGMCYLEFYSIEPSEGEAWIKPLIVRNKGGYLSLLSNGAGTTVRN